MNIEQSLFQLEFLNREQQISHASYDQELLFFESVAQGKTEDVKRLFKHFDTVEIGILSKDPVRNLKYHTIITIAFLARYCIEGGLEMETAYRLSDVYIRNVDLCNTEEEIHRLHWEVVDDFAHRMQLLHKTSLYSKPVTICIDYIHTRLHTGITLSELASVAGLSPSYLSRLFHREVGVTITGFILGKRVDAAENMLKYSDFSFVEISNFLGFSSESHFIQVFRKYTGYTPKVYRDTFFRTHWTPS